MTGDEEADEFAIGGIEVETLGAGVGKLQAGRHMIVAGHALAGIMQQQAEVKQFGFFEF